MNTIIIPTTQNIELEYPVANLGDRVLAGLIDLLILAAYVIIWMSILERYDSYTRLEDYTTNPLKLLVWLPVFFYSLVCEIFLNGRTLGKKVMNTQTIRLDGASPSLSAYLIRWMLRIIDIWISFVMLMPGLIGIISIAASKKGQRLGDIAAGTSVIKLKLVTTFGDTIFMDTGDTYEIVFPEIQRLSDRDVSILKEVLDAGLKSDNPNLLSKLTRKVKEVTGISSQMSPQTFLETVLKDYNHLYGRDR